MQAAFTDAEAARSFIRAGAARLTLRSLKTMNRYTYRVRAEKKNAPEGPRKKFYVDVLTGPDNKRDYTYLGMICGDHFFVTAATKHMAESAFAKAFSYAYRNLCLHQRLPPDAEVWHESTCGRCGRALTVPESIATGLGPECVKMIGRK